MVLSRSALNGSGKPAFRGAPLTITTHFLKHFCMRVVFFVSHYNETLFMSPYNFKRDKFLVSGLKLPHFQPPYSKNSTHC